jgi:hypothetical protein
MYYNPRYPGSFSGINAFNIPKHSKHKIAHYLTKQKVYAIHKPIVRHFKRRKVICPKRFVTLEIDLIDMQKLSRYNRGTRYLLTAICCFSRFAFVRLLKNKTASATLDALKSILKCTQNMTRYISCDEGGEFFSLKTRAYLKSKNITLYNSFNKTIKASIIERFNKTLQTRLYKYLYANNTSTYYPIIQQLVDSYNATQHSSIKMAPAQVTNDNSEQVWNTLYPYEKRHKNTFFIGDRVLIQKKAGKFDRGYKTGWEEDIHTVVTILNTTPFTYRLLNANGNPIRKRYYARELSRVRYAH